MGARTAATVRRLLGRERWYDRVGSMPTSNRHGLAAMAAVSGVATDVAVRYDSLGEDAGSVVTLGCGDKQLLKDFCEDLDAVDIGLEWVGRSGSARRCSATPAGPKPSQRLPSGSPMSRRHKRPAGNRQVPRSSSSPNASDTPRPA